VTRAVAARGRPRRRRRSADGDLGAPSGIVAIVGRPNVGKSTLFNRFTGQRHAIVDELAGLTRDRLYGVTEWRGRRFTVVDTAGLDPALVRDDPGMAVLSAGTQQQARLAIAEADVCVQLVDVRAGVTALDEDVAAILRSGGRPVILVGNKADSPTNPHYAHELYRLGLGEPVLVSALVGTDTGDLLDRMVEELPPADDLPDLEAPQELRLAIIGKPNVGKSSLLNVLVGEERALVSPLAGTTRDAVDTLVSHGDRIVRLVDTAGIRRRGVIDTNVEHYSLLRALRALERSDVALLVVDANDGIVAQDRHVAGYAVDAGKGLVVIANKWDLVDQEKRADPAFLKSIHEAFDFVPGVPVLTVSALEGRNVARVLDAATTVAAARAVRIPTAALNTLLRDAFLAHPPRHDKGRQLKLLYATQASTPAPTIVLFVNDPELMHFAYGRYLENRIRAVFGFAGTRMRIIARARAERDR
jgi:GTPase